MNVDCGMANIHCSMQFIWLIAKQSDELSLHASVNIFCVEYVIRT